MKGHLVFWALALPLTATPALAALELIPILRAVEIAEAEGKGQVVEVDLVTRRNGDIVFEVDVATKNDIREVEIDARAGKVLQQSPSRFETLVMRYWDKGSLPNLKTAKPLSEIIEAVERDSGGRVIDVDFEHEDGQSRYEFEVATNAGVASFYVDPTTGRRLSFVIDD